MGGKLSAGAHEFPTKKTKRDDILPMGKGLWSGHLMVVDNPALYVVLMYLIRAGVWD